MCFTYPSRGALHLGIRSDEHPLWPLSLAAHIAKRKQTACQRGAFAAYCSIGGLMWMLLLISRP